MKCPDCGSENICRKEFTKNNEETELEMPSLCHCHDCGCDWFIMRGGRIRLWRDVEKSTERMIDKLLRSINA